MGRLIAFLSLVVVTIAIAACGGAPGDGQEKSFTDVAQSAARGDDRVDVVELAGWLIEGRQDFELIDVRSADDYRAGSIGDAKNIPLAALVTEETLASLPADRKIVVYSNGSENAAKAAVMLRLAGLDGYLVTGGYNAWHARILNPDIPADELDGENLEVSEQRAYSCYFVGEREGGAATRDVERPVFEPPVITEEEELPPLPPAGAESC